MLDVADLETTRRSRYRRRLPLRLPSQAAPQLDLSAQLQQLAGLRDAGILTEDEFAAKKADILARM